MPDFGNLAHLGHRNINFQPPELNLAQIANILVFRYAKFLEFGISLLFSVSLFGNVCRNGDMQPRQKSVAPTTSVGMGTCNHVKGA